MTGAASKAADHVWFDQSAYDVRVEWGGDGLAALIGGSDVVVIVDVLSFSTCVDVAVGRGVSVLPFAVPGAEALLHARSRGAHCATARSKGRFSLSPASFASIPSGEKVVLPSPNGAALSLETGRVPTFTACLRNASAVARAVARTGRRITVVAAGERWPSGPLRPALEDWIGAGAVIAALGGSQSPEAQAAGEAFITARPRLDDVLLHCASGRELAGLGFKEDIALAAALDVSDCAPVLRDGAFTKVQDRQ